MSDMLEQAIIDAEALREAATKNAETLILEKYSNQIKGAVESLLEQDDLMAPLEAGGLEGTEAPLADAPDALAAEVSSVMQHIPLATTADNNDQIEIPLDRLLEEITELSETIRFNGDFIADEELYEHNIISEDLDEELTEDLDEELEISEDVLDEETLEEHLTVDLSGPAKGGYAVAPTSMVELAEEEILALEQDSKVREERAAIRKAVKELQAVSESTAKENKKLASALKRSNMFVGKLKDAVATLEEKLDKASVVNAKLLYQNKALESDSLNERQKQKLVEAVSNAETIEEAKVIFETLQNTVGSTSRKQQPNSLSEAVQKSSSVILSARKENSGGQKQNPTLDRWKFLAGIDK
jgi:hypothetical protein